MAFEKNLITITDIQKFKPISKNTDTQKKLDPFIQEAQEFELIPFLGDEFYLELLAEFFASPSLADQTYKDLFLGSTWEKNNRKYINPGVISMLCLYSYSRYLNRANTNSTAFGMVGKTNPDSEPLTEKTLGRLVGQATSLAKGYENRVKLFLDCNSADYPLYDCGITNDKTTGFRITAAGGNSNQRKVWDPVTKRFV